MKLLRKQRRQVPEDAAELRESFDRDGLLKLDGFFEPELCDRIATEAEEFYGRKGVEPVRAGRTMNFHQESPAAREALTNPRLLGVLEALLRKEPFFLQSIYFRRGSEQEAHSDYIFMSTAPVLQLCGVWIACEDVNEDAGPLIYYPGSHKIAPTGIPERYESRAEAVREQIHQHEQELTERYSQRRATTGESLLSCVFFDEWMSEMHKALEDGGFPRTALLLKKGDCVVWHATLMHGGSPVTGGSDRTRRSLVAHFLTTGVKSYYDMNYVDNGGRMTLKSIDKERPAELQVLAEAS
jgi:ectoine hydroxylase-related dioxygenase (phytanoyl-CoA dioxygenase family)